MARVAYGFQDVSGVSLAAIIGDPMGDFMRLFRSVSAALATSVLAASAFTGPAAAQTAGVGTSLTSTKVLTAQLGDNGALLDLLLLGDEARSTTDPAVAASEAFSRLTAVSAKTSIVPNNPINLTQGVFEAKSTGPTEVPIAATPIAALPSVPVDLAPVLSGSINPGKLTATLTNGVAAAGMNAELADISAVGGLVGLKSLKTGLGANSSGSASDALRGASLKDLTVLDLGALLEGLGLPLGELTPAQVVALVDALVAGTPLASAVPLPSGAATLNGALAQLNAAIDDLEGTIQTVPATTSDITDAIDAATKALLTAAGISSPLPTTSQAVAEATQLVVALVNELQAKINALLSDGLKALDGLALLRLEGVEVGVATKAVESVEGSVAIVDANIAKVLVGGVELPGVNLAAAAGSVNENVAALNAKIGSVLGLVDPGLAGLVKVSVLDQATSITQSGGYTRSRAGVTAATATITPPANLAALVKAIVDQVGVAQTLVSSTPVGTVPVLSSSMADLGGVLRLGQAVLSSPAKVQIASVLSASDFARAGVTTGAPGTGSPSLPRTGGPNLVLFGLGAGVLALIARRFSRPAIVQAVRVEQ
jgi:hypothetical protein